MPGAIEADNVSLAGYHDLDGRPAFKIAVREVDDRWYCYLAHMWHSGWSILDVTDPTAPSLETFVAGPANAVTKQLQVADGRMITALERPPPGYGPLDGRSCDPAAAHEVGASVWELADPTSPEPAGHYDTGGIGTHRNYYAGGDYAFMCACPSGFEPDAFAGGPNPAKNFFLTVVDIADPGHPEEVGHWRWPGQHPSDDEDRESMYFHGPAYVEGDRAYLSYGRVGCVTLDVADPTDPELVYRFDPGPGFGGHIGVHSFIPVPDTDLAVVNTETNAEADPLDPDGQPVSCTLLVHIGDERDPGFRGREYHGPRVVSSIPLPVPEADAPYDSYYEKAGRFGPHNQHHPRSEPDRLQSSELLVMTWFNAGLRVFDISDPLVPRETGYFVPEAPPERIADGRPSRESGLGSQLEDVVVDARGYAYCSDPQQGLFVLDLEMA